VEGCTVELDLGYRAHAVCVLDAEGKVVVKERQTFRQVLCCGKNGSGFSVPETSLPKNGSGFESPENGSK
jgi:hypothetical protein